MAISTSNPAVFTTGPVHMFLELPSTVRWYLGTAETAPLYDFEEMKVDVFNDLGGRLIPFQRIDAGTMAQVSMSMTRYSELAYQELQKFNTSGTVRGIGTETRYNRGSLVIGVKTVKLWMVNDFYKYGDPTTGTPAETNLPPGLLLWAAELGKHGVTKQGTEGKTLMLSFRGWPLWTASTRAFATYSVASGDFPAELWTDAQ